MNKPSYDHELTMKNESNYLSLLIEAVNKYQSPDKILSLFMSLNLDVRLRYGMLEIKDLHYLLTKHLHKDDVKSFKKQLGELEEKLIESFLALHPELTQKEFSAPYLKDGRELIIPSDCHGRYRYWLNNEKTDWNGLNPPMTLLEILVCLSASKKNHQ